MKVLLFIIGVVFISQTYSFKLKQTNNRRLEKADCTININEDLPKYAPLLLETETTDVLYPNNDDGLLELSNGENIEAVCAGRNFQNFDADNVIITCKSGSFQIDNTNIALSDISCTKDPFHTARYTGKKCAEEYQEIEIGFLLNDGRFVRQILTCFDSEGQNTLYSHHNITRFIASHTHDVPRPSFIADNFYKVNVNKLYNRVAQRETINALVGLEPDSEIYIQSDTYYYLSRGHFAPKAAFVYPIQQKATFHYVNTAPQWQTFNGENWNYAEMDVRQYAQDHHVDVQVYTGSYGIATLPHAETDNLVPLYLYADGESRGLPVPKLYWKVVYEPESKAGVALIGVNNPYVEEIGDNLVCKDVSSKISWLTWDADNAAKGFSYACEISDFRKTVTYVPKLDVKALLS